MANRAMTTPLFHSRIILRYITNLKKAGQKTMFSSVTEDKSAQSTMEVLQESINKTVEHNPDLAVQSNNSSAASVPPSIPAGSAGVDITAASTEYSKVQLSQENMMVDTYTLISIFTQKGFTVQQAECITYTFTHLMNDALREQRKHCVEKAGLDVMREQVMAHIGALRKDMTILEKSELSDLRNENEKLKLLLVQHGSQMSEDVNKVKNQLTLDINMERSRAKDDHTTTEKNLSNLTTKMTAELGSLETTFERYKNDIYKFIVGSILSGLTIGMGAYRIFKS